jgi:hypothetical protein
MTEPEDPGGHLVGGRSTDETRRSSASTVLIENAKRDLLAVLPKDTALNLTYKGIAAVLRLLTAERRSTSGRTALPAALTLKKDLEALAMILEHKEGAGEEALAEISGEMAQAF